MASYSKSSGSSYDNISYQSVIFIHLLKMSDMAMKLHSSDTKSRVDAIDTYREMVLYLDSLLSPYISASDEEDVNQAIGRFKEIRSKSAFHDERYMISLRSYFSTLVDIMHKNNLLMPPSEPMEEDIDNVPRELIVHRGRPRKKPGV